MEWRPPESESDISRLNKLVEYYESVNLEQIQQIANLKQAQEANLKTMLEYEKNKKLLMKTVKSLEGRMKFDKIAADGTKKKFNLLEYEVREIKHTNEQLTTEKDEDKAMIAQLKDDLNSNRSDKLKFMHENAILKKQAATLTVKEQGASADAVFARSDLLDKLQTLDNAIAQNEILKRTISAQSEEMLTLSHEQHDLNEKLFAANKQVVNLELMTAEHNRTIDILQHEISRLRKELASSSHSFNVKSSALLTRGGGANPSNRVSTDITHSSYGHEGDGPYALSRRPHTQQGLSRERNQLASTSASRGASRNQQRRSLGDSSPFHGEKSNHTNDMQIQAENAEHEAQLRGSDREYQYVDLSSHLQRPTTSATSVVLVAGGSIGTNGDSVNKTIRTSLLQDYNDVVGGAKVDLSLKIEPVQESALGVASYSNSGDFQSTASSYSAMCSPVSTPFRPLSSQKSALKPLLHLPQHKDSGTWFQQRPQTQGTSVATLSESLSSIKKCYSMPLPAKKLHSAKPDVPERVSTALNNLTNDDPGASSAFSTSQFPSNWHATNTPSSAAHVSFQPPTDVLKVKEETNHKSSAAVNRSKAKSLHSESSNKKSIFVGAGLGLKHNAALDAELQNLNKGSTHQILKKILGDRFD